MDYEKIIEENDNLIPSDWYVPARTALDVFTWAMKQVSYGIKFSDVVINDYIRKYRESIENKAIALGEEKKV